MCSINKLFQFDNINLSLLIAVLSLIAPSICHAQTCRVSVGTSADGCQTFREVFEYDFVDVKPTFPGGNEALLGYINETRKYPEEAYEQGIEGRVVCSFVVNADGNISNLRVIKGCHKSLNLEAMRILAEMPDWIPGKLCGKHVPVRVVYSVPFRK